MKRLIKIWDKYGSDDKIISLYSTNTDCYECLPELLEADSKTTLRDLIKKYNINTIGNVKTVKHVNKWVLDRPYTVTHYIKTTETRTNRFNDKNIPVYLCLINIPEFYNIKPLVSLKNAMTDDQAYEVINNQAFNIYDVAEIDGNVTLVMEGWHNYHDFDLLGYDREQFFELLNLTYECFSDSVFRCHECGDMFYEEDGYQYKYRIVDDCYQLGVSCGCYDAYCEENYVEGFGNNPDKAIERDLSKKLVERKEIKFIERFIGGWVDGRGGSYAGQSVREGDPKEVLEDLLERNPDKTFVFCHDESGQFQTYFSVYEVI